MIFRWLYSRAKEWYDVFEGLIQGAFWFWCMVSVIFGLVILPGDGEMSNGEPISHVFLLFVLINFVMALSMSTVFVGYKVFRSLRDDFRNFVTNYEKPKRQEYDSDEPK